LSYTPAPKYSQGGAIAASLVKNVPFLPIKLAAIAPPYALLADCLELTTSGSS